MEYQEEVITLPQFIEKMLDFRLEFFLTDDFTLAPGIVLAKARSGSAKLVISGETIPFGFQEHISHSCRSGIPLQ